MEDNKQSQYGASQGVEQPDAESSLSPLAYGWRASAPTLWATPILPSPADMRTSIV